MKKQKLIVVLGPTSSGKSDLAVEIAKEFGGEVISADSRQVYKGMDIGTGKITKKEMRSVPHYLLDVANPKKQFTVSNFVNLGQKAIFKIIKKKKVPIICGGTGFYISALLGESLVPEVPPNIELRKKLENKSPDELFKMLQKLDPKRSVAIDRYNSRRLIRAIEICKALGPNSASRFAQASRGKKVPKYDVLKIGIKIPNEELKNRIERRIDKWFRQGLIKEVQDLHKKGLTWKRMSEIGLEYKLVANFLKSQKVSRVPLDTSQLKKEMAEKTWQYAKRQKTWFQRDKEIRWFAPKELNKVEKEVRKFFKN